ncbi:MAG: hypothetical protein Q7K26_04745 [bacterium]|nr:hypothetical protein [bacterium]
MMMKLLMIVPGDNYKNGARMEDYFTHQPNLVLLLTGISNKLSTEEKSWFYNNWINLVNKDNRKAVSKTVIELISKTEAINKAREELKKIKEKLQISLLDLPNEEFKQNMSKWAFRSFPID